MENKPNKTVSIENIMIKHNITVDAMGIVDVVNCQNAMEEYAQSQTEELRGEIESLEEWKSQQIEVMKRWDKVYDFAQKSKLFKWGVIIPDRVLEILESIEILKLNK